MTAIVNKGTGYAISATTAASNTNAGAKGNQWQFVNATANVAVVNVYTSNVSVTTTTGVAVPAGASQVVMGDFGPAYQGNVWISTILAAGTGTIYATPVLQK